MKDEDIASIVRRAVMECLALPRGNEIDWNDPAALFYSPAAMAVKEEMIRAGLKLWQRQYVDGNGGNMSYRISDEYVIATPTLLSKADLTLDDFSLVDLKNKQACGSRRSTSELLLHLEIYKAVPAARAVVHCHPPYATAHAIAGIAPPPNLIPEQEVFVGPVAVAPYDTPGTQAFAETILPFAKNHNTMLLTNHGIVCWADTITHAEWYVEVIETYCKTAMIARQLRPQLTEIPPDKVQDLLTRKKTYGLPDARFEAEYECSPALGSWSPAGAEQRKESTAASSAEAHSAQRSAAAATATGSDAAVESLIAKVTMDVKGLLATVRE